jgi:two-component system chemotaxis response regulator CheB
MVVSVVASSSAPPRFEVVATVASLGGLTAITEILGALPASFPTSIVVIQHGRPSDDDDRFAKLLTTRTALPVRTAATGRPLHAPGVTVIPTGYTAHLEPDRTTTISDGDPLHSGDEFLHSLAHTTGPAAIAVILTGMLDDGANGVRAIKLHGGRVLVQDPHTARAPGMPSHAMATGCVDHVLPLHRIPAGLIALTMAPGGADLLTVPMPPWAQPHTPTRNSA